MALTDKLTAIADAIRGKTGKTDEMTLDQMATEIAGIEAGGGGGDNPLDYAVTCERMFYNTKLAELADINLSFGNKIAAVTTSGPLRYTFSRCTNLRSVKVNYGGPVTTVTLDNTFDNSAKETALVRADLTGLLERLIPSNISKIFYCRNGLVEVLGEFDLSNCINTQYAFDNCGALEYVRFKEGTIKVNIGFVNSPKLTDATIQSIIDGLADLTGGTAQTLTLHATVGAKLTDAQKSVASAKNWTISY